MALLPVDTGEVEALLAPGPGEIAEGDALLLLSCYIPYLAADGGRASAHPWIRAFRLAAEAAGHAYRVGDVATFELADSAPYRPFELRASDEIPRWNWLARWRIGTLRLRAAALGRDPGALDEALESLSRARRRAVSARLDDAGCFEAYVRALAGGTPQITLSVPPPPHLLSLASVLAGAEAIGIAGTQVEAADWLRWLEDALPDRIETCLEWPVSRARVQGLVALRAGDAADARAWFNRAIAWTERVEYPVERAIAQVQLAELLHHHRAPYLELTWRSLREAGWNSLRALGIDPIPFAYAVARSSIDTRDQVVFPSLSPREAEVLALLAEGLTYRAIAERLGVGWATVQTLAHRCYKKLGVSGKTRAIQLAKELQIL